jgi:hypothetical protein
MKKSVEVIDYIKNNIDSRNYISLFVSGSIPEYLIKKKDLDIFVIMKKERTQQCLNNIDSIMKEYLHNENDTAYSFFRGPIKHTYKGLVSFSIYTDDDATIRASIYHENLKFLEQVQKTEKTLGGKKLCEVLKDAPHATMLKTDASKNKKAHDRYKTLIEKNYIKYPQWTKIAGEWELVSKYKKTGKWYKQYLIEYFNKWK